MERRAVVAFVALVAVFGAASAAPARAGTGASWIRPVSGAVVRAFDPPRTRFGAGHLGVDLRAPRGSLVRAAGAGVVSFEGSVAAALHVVIAHGGNLRTSYSFLASVAVRRGQRVEAGEAIGTTGGHGEGHDGSVVHIGLRIGDTYVDPMVLFAPVDLAAAVHLAPTTDPPHPAGAASERRGLLAGLAHAATAVVHFAGSAAETVGGVVAAGARGAARAAAARYPVPAAVVAATLAWSEQRGHCDAHAPPADGSGGSGHRAMLVAGIESSRTGSQPSVALPVSRLGYEPGEVASFSYAPGGGDYTPADTEGPIMVAARELAAQLRAMQRSEPGREVDLLAHSQGGVVVEAFLTLIYKRNDRSYPPLGTVVTLSSPLRGDPLASAASDIGRSTSGAEALRAVRGVADAAGARLPVGTAAQRDLAADSALMRKLDAARLPDEVELTTIGGATDVVVPGNAATRPGARGITILPRGLNAHTAVLNDPWALRVVRAALENKPMPCQSLRAALTASIVSTTISTLEERAGQFGAVFGRVADVRP